MGIYERIKVIATEKGYSINKLEKELGFPRSSMNKYNINTPSIERVQKIANFLGVSVSDITGEDSDDEKYYISEETAQIAQEIFENKELRALFDVQRDLEPEDLKALHGMAVVLKRKERGEMNDTGC